VVLDVRKSSAITDYIVIISGTSDRQVIGIAEHIEETMSKEKVHPIGKEGMREGRWILMDYGDVIIHVFLEPVRFFFDIEGIWPDVPHIRYDEMGEIIGEDTSK
jgi:ribosome-associated protein